ncbi:MAG: ABC transporter ATP-binding protein/permease [Ruminococcaceae bacterium]|nr:ABC transporter ATP-binding protein/permease [Oscillospiraceae bacterium]
MLQLKEIKKDYVTSSETVSALKGVSISFRKKEFVSILGPSGCGKTTLLNIIGGLDHYTSGDLIIGGRSTKSYKDRDWDVYRNHRIGFIFQSYNLIPHQTILGNVELALTISGVSREDRIKRAKDVLDRVGLKGQYYKKPNQLSGGQCQRVAIARALVNDPEILLADEPTGALDTVTSVQIMELIKEISGERLVIMVTHNPELADKYSTRIVRLLDGNVIEDTNPFSPEEEALECEITNKKENEEFAALLEQAESKKEKKKISKSRKEKAKMSFFTAFMLSAKNLLSKKGRTTMVGIAGSIGIIGIAVVLAFSAGIKGYIASMQDDMLSGNPITITETTYDMNAITDLMNSTQKQEIVKKPNRAYINSLIKYIADMSEFSDSLIIQNDISEKYVNYVKNMPKEYYNAMILDYGIDMSYSVFTDFVIGSGTDKKTENISIAALTDIYTSVLKDTKFAQYASYITQIVPSFAQAPNNPDYIAGQYDVYGEIADEYNEVMLVLNSNQELSDMLLARLGYYTEEQFYNLIYKVSKDDEGNPDERYNPELDVEYFDYSALMNDEKTFTWYQNDLLYTKCPDTVTLPGGQTVANSKVFDYNYNSADILGDGIELKVVGILIANEETSYGCLSSGIYYTEALTNHILEKNIDSEIVNYIAEKGDITSMSYNGMNVGIYYSYEYRPILSSEAGTVKTGTAFVGETYGIEDMLGAMGSMGGSSSGGTTGGMGGATGIDMTSIKTASARMFGGVDIANSISIYPKSFDEKDLVTNYLDEWNDYDGSLTVGDKNLTKDERSRVTYTDTLELIINMINTMIDIVSYALIAFTSVSLVVSTVMIGIITFVSVVERIKEIGVIRALGGRKKDVSHLFNAETFIVGLLAGLIGVGATYLISFIVNLILKPLIGYAHIASLPLSNAIILVILSVGLTLISGLIPAKSAANRDPVVALRTE